MKITTTLIAICFFSLFGYAQEVAVSFQPLETVSTAHPSFVFQLDVQALESQLGASTTQDDQREAQFVKLPMPDGGVKTLSVEYAPIIASELAAKFPEIKSYRVKGDGISGRVGMTYKGFHAMLFTPDGTVYIDQIDASSSAYASYFRNDFVKHHRGKQHHCEVDGEVINEDLMSLEQRGGARSGDQLRTYRLALACTGEYAQFHGGTVSGVLSAMVVTMNRVNGVYERDLSITMEIIGNNDDLIFFNSSTDPYSNGSGSAMLGQNQSTVNSIIGSSNYDIGHVFSTGGGGIASLGSVCTSSKAQGVTGSGSPTGDPFDIDFVAHEIGHQFGGNHTYNGTAGSCGGNRTGSAAFEPGSGTTIMAYAGICGAHNTQSNSDDYFHAYSLQQMIAFSTSGSGNNCASTTNTGNNAPVVDAGSGGFFIPAETPFVLTGSASDPDGDVNLTYCWEQMDLGPGGSPDSPVSEAPIFRSWDPVAVTQRTFPREVNVVIGNTVFGETYATYSREMNFRLTVRDNDITSGGMGFDDLSFDIDGNSGPFVVTSPNAGAQVEAGNGFEVTWDVAGTNVAPVNCQNVVIELCTFSGGAFTVIETLSASTPNDGSETVTIPIASIGGGRYLRVRADGNIFFNINGGSFSVVEPSLPDDFGITLTATPDVTNNLVQLNWTDSFSNENQFMIERSLNGNANFILIDSVAANVTTYNDLTAQMAGENYYRVRAGNAGGFSVYSNEATYQGVGFNALRPEQLRIFPNPATERLTISWSDVNADEIMVYGADGRVIQILQPSPGASQQVLDVSGLSGGQYWLKFTGTQSEGAVLPFQVID